MSSPNPEVDSMCVISDGLLEDGGLEKVYDYESGGHHPVHLGGVLHKRYKVLHKLGSGGFANVWLCHDTIGAGARYMALKIIMAEESTPDSLELRLGKVVEEKLGSGPYAGLFCLPLDRFEIDGPNGVHHVLAYPVLVPRVSIVYPLDWAHAASTEVDTGLITRNACTIFEIHMRKKLFGMFEDELDEHLFDVAAVLGRLPEPWWSETWKGRRENFKDEMDKDGRVVAASSNVTINERPRSLREAIAPRYEGRLYELNKHHLGDISEGEVDLLSDLLGRMLRYSPAERISAKEALEHDWFRFQE